MPKSTFLHLKSEKKSRFTEAALTEFALYDYESASVSRLVQVLGIAKGSFYQYFEDKKDLYFYLIAHINQQKQTSLAAVFKQKYADFFELYERMYVAGTLFDLAHPLYTAFMQNVSRERNSADLGNLQFQTKKQSTHFFHQLLQAERTKGKLREDIDLDTLSYWLVQTGIGLNDLLLLKYGVDFRGIVAKTAQMPNIRPQEIEKVVKCFITLLKVGMFGT
jgi:AcrR family transcriptional regulator